MVKKHASARLTDSQKADIRKEFREWSGGYHPGEAGDESEKFLEQWADVYGHDALEAFLTAWGEEETEKDLKKHEKDEAKRKADLKKRLHEIAKSCVTMNEWKTQVTVKVDDVTIYLEVHKSKTKAKAEWADCVWMLEKMLERGAKEAGEP
jgi:hypothetical protein